MLNNWDDPFAKFADNKNNNATSATRQTPLSNSRSLNSKSQSSD